MKVSAEREELDRVVVRELLGLRAKDQENLYRGVVKLVRSRIGRARSVSKRESSKGIRLGISKSIFAPTKS